MHAHFQLHDTVVALYNDIPSQTEIETQRNLVDFDASVKSISVSRFNTHFPLHLYIFPYSFSSIA